MNKSMIYFPREDSETKMFDLQSLTGKSLYDRTVKEEKSGGGTAAVAYEPIFYKKP
jgi:hypothetical protein